MKNSERFIVAFNRIEKELQQICNVSYAPFSKLLQCARPKNAAVRKYEQQLRKFAQLRNAIVHDQIDPSYTIAEPHHQIVQQIEQIARRITRPVTVGQRFRKKVHILQADDTLIDGLQLIRSKRFNQFPIYQKRRFVGLITAMGITYWLSSRMTNGLPSGKVPTLRDVYRFEKRKKSYTFVEQSMPVYEAEEIFKRSVASGKRIEALLMTENGRPKEKLLGIITPLDLVRYQE